MPSIQRAFADSSLGEVHYRYLLTDNEPKKRPIVFLHTSASSSANCEKMMKMFAPLGHDCYAPDMPGFGESFDPAEDPVNIAWYVHVYAEVFQDIGFFDDGFHIVGYHAGASIAIEMETLYMNVIRSICMIGPIIMLDRERAMMRKDFQSVFNKPILDGSGLTKAWKYLAELGVGDNVESKHREALNHTRAWKGRYQIYNAVLNQDSEAVFVQVSCPVMALRARDDILWPYFDNVQKIRPGTRVEEIKGADFEPDRDAEGIYEEYTDFLRSVEKWDTKHGISVEFGEKELEKRAELVCMLWKAQAC
ncbi:MAG: hypothetical protein M1834_002154 [Cirrosporium novae-zelandiae]|nr:MAG: hypothetical protein M1834_002154 [Cirrosporium novae-zelandiae]